MGRELIGADVLECRTKRKIAEIELKEMSERVELVTVAEKNDEGRGRVVETL